MNSRFCTGCAQSLLLAISLAACAAPGRDAAPLRGPETAVAYASAFVLAGRISVRVGDRIDSGSVRWSRNANEETIGFYTPLGSQVAEFKRTAAGVSLIRGQDRQDSASVAELTEALFGVAIDLDLLARLVQGADALQTRWVSGDGREWRLQAEEFSAAGPHRHARRVSIESGDARVRLVIDEWQAL